MVATFKTSQPDNICETAWVIHSGVSNDTTSDNPFPPDIVEAILTHLDLPPSFASLLTTRPLAFLSSYITSLPETLLTPFAQVTTPRERSTILPIKSRRVLHASSTPRPRILSSEEGRLRWPLLWERLGGTKEAPATTLAQREEEEWVEKEFMHGKERVNHVKKLGALLRENQEMREWEEARESRRVERELDEIGEEFEEESDEEDEEGDGQAGRVGTGHPVVSPDQEEVKIAFEKRLLEMFIDGLDRVDYTPIDFREPEGGDPIAQRDAEDRYFDDEEPSGTPKDCISRSGTEIGNDAQVAEQSRNGGNVMGETVAIGSEGLSNRPGGYASHGNEGRMALQNGQGEYDY